MISGIAHPDYLRDRPHLRQFMQGFEPILIAQARQTDPADFDLVSPGRRTTFVAGDDVGFEFSSTQWMESVLRIDLNAGTATKSIGSRYAGFDIYGREIEWLRRLQPTGIVPELLSTTDNTITTRYVGEPVSPFTLPFDWREQAENILSMLADAGCNHNDISAGNILVADGRLRLIDFAWALPAGTPVPADWPEELGRHRFGTHQFDDRHAIFEALAEKEALARQMTGVPVS